MIAVVVVAGAAGGAIVAVSSRSDGSSSSGTGNLAAGHAPTTAGTTAPTSTTRAPTTSTTRPHIHQPKATLLPAAPTEGLSWGSSGPVVLAVQKRLKQLHFDPGKLDGEYGQDTNYAVTAADKLLGLPRDGRITPAVEAGLDRFKFSAAMPKAEGNRVEINLDTQVLTVFKNYQPILITTTSTGSGEHFCGGTDGCQYAITPAGHFHFQYLHPGWDNGKLGKMWNPYYFNGGIAVHGLQSVPAYPASHGCARIPMDIANYFPSLVTKGESVYVVGTPMKGATVRRPGTDHHDHDRAEDDDERAEEAQAPEEARVHAHDGPPPHDHGPRDHDVGPQDEDDVSERSAGRVLPRPVPRSRAPRARRRARVHPTRRSVRRASRARGRAGAR